LNINSNISQELLETIEHYYNGTMDAETLKTFEERLASDAQFGQLVEDVRSLFEGIERQALKEKLDEFHQELEKRNAIVPGDGKVRFLYYKKIAVAAVLVIALGSLWFFTGSANERLYNNHFSPDPGLPTTMGGSENFAFFDAMVDYKQKNYDTAIDKWLVLHKKNPQNDTINYFLGSAYLAKGNGKQAATYLQKTVEQPESTFKSDAHYYLGLLNLKEGNVDEAKKNLQQSHHENAVTVLDKLKD